MAYTQVHGANSALLVIVVWASSSDHNVMVRYVDKFGNILMESMLFRLFYQRIELTVASKISYNYP